MWGACGRAVSSLCSSHLPLSRSWFWLVLCGLKRWDGESVVFAAGRGSSKNASVWHGFWSSFYLTCYLIFMVKMKYSTNCL